MIFDPDKFHDKLIAELQKAGAQFEIHQATSCTWQDVLATLDEIEANKPTLICRPEDEQRLTDLAEQHGLPIKILANPECPPGSMFVFRIPRLSPPTVL